MAFLDSWNERRMLALYNLPGNLREYADKLGISLQHAAAICELQGITTSAGCAVALATLDSHEQGRDVQMRTVTWEKRLETAGIL